MNVRTLIDFLWRIGLIIKFEMYYRNRPYVALVDEVRNFVARLIVEELLAQWENEKLETYR